MLSLLTTFAPVILNVGLWLINIFVTDQAQRDANEKAFLQAISNHAGDALASVLERINAAQQYQDLQQEAAAADAAAAAAAAAAVDNQPPKQS